MIGIVWYSMVYYGMVSVWYHVAWYGREAWQQLHTQRIGQHRMRSTLSHNYSGICACNGWVGDLRGKVAAEFGEVFA